MVGPLTSQEIARYRSQLASYPVALEALEAIENCEGDLEDAAVSLAIQAGQQPDCSDWLAGLAKRCRAAICQDPIAAALSQDRFPEAFELVQQSQICPPLLAIPVLIYVTKVGLEPFCQPLDLKIQ